MNDFVLSIMPLVAILSMWLISLFVLAFIIWMLVLSFRRSVIWFILILLFPLLGALFYYISYRPKFPTKYRKFVTPFIFIELILVSFFLLALVSPSLAEIL